MKIIALECGGAIASCAALEIWGEAAQLAASISITEPRALSRLVMATFDAVLHDAQWKLQDLDALAIGVGPGSWTSLRIGLSTFVTLAQTLHIPLAGAPTFDAIASAVFRARLEAMPRRKKSKNLDLEPRIALVLAPCRPGALYGKIFEMSADSLAPAQSEWIADAKMHLDGAYSQGLSSEIEPPLLLCGEAASEAAQMLEARGEPYELAEVAPEAIALEIALAGAAQIARGEVGNPLEVAPLYLAPSHAERHLAGF